jgi:small nuclear ribonucleoprotein (snRNP)-like protein
MAENRCDAASTAKHKETVVTKLKTHSVSFTMAPPLSKPQSTALVSTHKKPHPSNNKHSQTTLGSLLRYFVGIELKVELKTGRVYQGTLESSSADNNDSLSVTLSDATVFVTTTADSAISNTEQQHHSSLVTIRGSLVRFIQFPDDISLPATIQQGMEREKAARQKYQRPTRSSSSRKKQP